MWIPRRNCRFNRRWNGCSKAVRRSSLPTGFRRFAMPTKSSCFNNGQIVEMGNHDELMAKKGLYRNLVEAQFKFLEDEAGA